MTPVTRSGRDCFSPPAAAATPPTTTTFTVISVRSTGTIMPTRAPSMTIALTTTTTASNNSRAARPTTETTSKPGPTVGSQTTKTTTSSTRSNAQATTKKTVGSTPPGASTQSAAAVSSPTRVVAAAAVDVKRKPVTNAVVANSKRNAVASSAAVNSTNNIHKPSNTKTVVSTSVSPSTGCVSTAPGCTRNSSHNTAPAQEIIPSCTPSVLVTTEIKKESDHRDTPSPAAESTTALDSVEILPKGPSGFIGIEKLLQRHFKQIKQFEYWAKSRAWATFNSSHYDWWAFPIDEKSQMGSLYQVDLPVVTALLSNQQFITSWSRGVELVTLCWGWSIHNRQWIKNPDRDQRWLRRPVRLWKVGRSCQLFGTNNKDSPSAQFFDSMLELTKQLESMRMSLSWGTRKLPDAWHERSGWIGNDYIASSSSNKPSSPPPNTKWWCTSY